VRGRSVTKDRRRPQATKQIKEVYFAWIESGMTLYKLYITGELHSLVNLASMVLHSMGSWECYKVVNRFVIEIEINNGYER